MNYMNNIIVSNQNKLVKYIKSLHNKKYREQYNEYVVEGIKIVHEALLYACNITYMVFTEGHEKIPELSIIKEECIKREIQQYVVDDKVFRYISDTENPQGVLCVVKKRQFDYDLIMDKEKLNLLILDEIQDPGNLGTIIRTADAFNIDAVILTQGCVDLYNSKTIRSTMGSLFHIPIVSQIDADIFIKKLKDNDIVIVGADPYGTDITEYHDNIKRIAIVIGNEARGINPNIKKSLDISLRIPMPGNAESLNAGIAAALMIYEVSVKRSLV